jgi:hypothetical protein
MVTKKSIEHETEKDKAEGEMSWARKSEKESRGRNTTSGRIDVYLLGEPLHTCTGEGARKQRGHGTARDMEEMASKGMTTERKRGREEEREERRTERRRETDSKRERNSERERKKERKIEKRRESERARE